MAPPARPVRRRTGTRGTGSRALRPTAQLRSQLADSLRARLRDGEWTAGERLPTEAALTAEYGVSRSTVRAALQQLEAQGLTRTRHGIGTFATAYGNAVHAGLQELRSMTETIAAQGLRPGMDYHSARFRKASRGELGRLERAGACTVLATERAVLADDTVVAFSYEVIPADLLPADLDPATLSGSLFQTLEEVADLVPVTAIADVSAATGRTIGWGPRPRGAVYLLLDQAHYDRRGQAVIYSRTYFIQGRFQFSLLRTR